MKNTIPSYSATYIQGARLLYLRGLCKKDEKVAFVNHVPCILKKTWLDRVKERVCLNK